MSFAALDSSFNTMISILKRASNDEDRGRLAGQFGIVGSNLWIGDPVLRKIDRGNLDFPKMRHLMTIVE